MQHPSEWLDIVNDQNEVVGKASREEVHRNGWAHRTVHLLLVSPLRHFLLQRRSASCPSYPRRWDSSVSGHVATGESFLDTVRREAREEIGVEIETAVPLLLIEASPDTDQEWIQFFIQPVKRPPRLKTNSPEVTELRWWSEEELLHSLVKTPEEFTPGFSILFFLWREARFVTPIPLPDGWFLIEEENMERADVQRAFLESAGLRARVAGKDRWADPRGGKPIFDFGHAPPQHGLCVPAEELPEAIALLYLSRPVEEI